MEVKYCQDTDKSTQALRATRQHEALKQALLQLSRVQARASTYVITLGATGTIYTDTHSMLRHLGIDGKTASQWCCADLHIHAVSYVMRLLRTKWAQEHSARKRGIG